MQIYESECLPLEDLYQIKTKNICWLLFVMSQVEPARSGRDKSSCGQTRFAGGKNLDKNLL